MAVRRETVRLEVEDHFTKEMLKAVTAAEKLDKALRPLTGSAGGSSKSFDKVVRQVEGLGRASRRSRTDIDNMARRLRLLSTALSGLDPAAESLESARRAIGQIAPETQQAVGQLQRLPAVIEGVRSQTDQDWLPGLNETLKSLEVISPRVAEGVTGVSAALRSSDLGGPILTGLAALSLYERGLQGTAAAAKNLAGSKFLSGKLEEQGVFGATKSAATATRSRIKLLRADLRSMSREYPDLNKAQSLFHSGMEQSSAAAKRTGSALKTTGLVARRTAGPLAALTLATTGLGESFGGTVTEMALAGSAFGPWGAAAGAVTGMVLDAAAANDAFVASFDGVHAAVAAGDLPTAQVLLQQGKADVKDFNEKVEWDTEDILQTVTGIGVLLNGSEIKNSLKGVFGKSDVEDGAEKERKAQKEVEKLERSQQRLADLQGRIAAENHISQWAHQVAGSMRSLATDVQKPTTSLETLERRMREMGRADAQMGKNINKALDNGASADAIQQIIEDLGPEAGLALEQLANGGQAAARRLNRAFRVATKGAGGLEGSLGRVGRAVGLLPNGKRIKITANTAGAVSAIGALLNQAQSLRRLRLDFVGSGASDVTGAAGGRGKADGGTVPKTGLGYADRHLYLLADGEEVISNRHGQADRHRSLLKEINANRLADGGTTGPRDRGRPRDAGRSSDRFDLPRTLRGLNKVLEESRRALKHEKDTREELTDKMPSLRETVAGKLTSELFGETDAWSAGSSFADVMAKLDGDIASGNQLNRNIADLRRKGVSGDALATLLAEGDSSTIAGFAALSAGQLKTYQDRFGERAALASGNRGVGAAAAAAAYKAQNDAAAANVKKLEAKLDAIEKAIRAEHRQDRRSNQRGRGNAARSKKGK
ncbi:hypothetical protein [Pimelobacter sp. 30-1]|uniref:hypothetical protein n=1 Tax=Pimelobacter sp. 30-1 TaxID=2004991 RepID=UPI001C04804E|nr:hypothetical protein [Pimelobacter sp. 30-1]MBU2693860.1 hypothetical protein [Pimelobacter sp. 30-1]